MPLIKDDHRICCSATYIPNDHVTGNDIKLITLSIEPVYRYLINSRDRGGVDKSNLMTHNIEWDSCEFVLYCSKHNSN